MYSADVLKHFKNPHNMGKVKNPDGIGKVGNIVCGDVMWLYIKVGKSTSRRKKGKEIITDVKFETFGCTAAIATSSMITDLAKGKTFEEALKINKQEITDSLGGLPPIKVHCSILASDALVEAIYDYLSKNKKPVSKELEKRHLRIKKEKEIIEERYKEWVGKQQEIVEKD
ncbi:iron-sulfur cluster assembly scaffold protein [Candidatus Curtissbacteria bacterium RBG_16_39_7]|uniref:Iron-sulfur cluster assembly scaffold protein n=1 Tax=Candidatus Curtissbacteria bacterium RBG_16_39_7 TaxID=1797707 RepID=A0A1F5G1H5_9BACT|nr:MAG: iron-sulfur cluster assembly scaffold protein [Candidatus Curtissbacteria bacterium RBG_16_39_7]